MDLGVGASPVVGDNALELMARRDKKRSEPPKAEVRPSTRRKYSTFLSGRTDQAEVPLGAVLPDADMPIDPNEPTYCICNRVSFGEMIACDSSEVRSALTSSV